VFLAVPLALALYVLVTLSPADVGGYVGVPLFMWVATSLNWLFTVTTAIRVRPDGLIIDNMLVRHVLPWERFAGLSVQTGKGMFACLDDGTEIRSSSFGRSLADAMQGYAHVRETAGQITQDCRAARAAHAAAGPPRDTAPQWQLNVPWRPLLAFLVLFEAFSWVTFAIHGG
jgi:hypothetical protein